MYKRIDHVALHVADLDRSVSFYERHFGFKDYFRQATPDGIRIAYLRLGDTVLELTHRSEGPMNGCTPLQLPIAHGDLVDKTRGRHRRKLIRVW